MRIQGRIYLAFHQSDIISCIEGKRLRTCEQLMSPAPATILWSPLHPILLRFFLLERNTARNRQAIEANSSRISRDHLNQASNQSNTGLLHVYSKEESHDSTCCLLPVHVLKPEISPSHLPADVAGP